MQSIGLAPQYWDVVDTAQRMWEATEYHNGGTFNARTGLSVDLGNIGGYVVANNKDRMLISSGEEDEIALQLLASFLQRQPTYGDGRKDDVGLWVNCGVVYVDTVEYVSDKYDALALGIKYNQIAIWDIANACEIVV